MSGHSNAEVGGWAGGRTSTLGFRSKTWVCFGRLTTYLVYGKGGYIKRQFGIATQVSVIKVTVKKLLKKEIQFPLKNLNFLRPIDTTFSILVAYMKTQLGIATEVSVNTAKVSVL